MHEWTKIQLIGLSVKNWNEFIRALLLGANMVEIKVEKFAENGLPLYTYRKNGNFIQNRKNLSLINRLAKKNNIAVQLHLPIERCLDLTQEAGINIGFVGHHEIALRRFEILENIYRDFGIGSVITMHPPTISFDGNELIKVEESLENARIFFEKLDDLRLKKNHQTLIGIENQPSPKLMAASLGSNSEHFKIMLRNTRTIGVTIDSGHRLLADKFTVTQLLGFAFPVNNFHFHGNHGEFKADNFDDDEHKLPMPDNVKGYKNYIRYFRRHRTPIVLELSHLKQYKDEELANFIFNLKCQVE
jgi:sugar phosphate isomerase/epimerase